MGKIIEFYKFDTSIEGTNYFTQRLGSDSRCVPDQRLGIERLKELGHEILKRDGKVTGYTHFKIRTKTLKDLTGYIEGK